jgi:hypothetical protein
VYNLCLLLYFTINGIGLINIIADSNTLTNKWRKLNLGVGNTLREGIGVAMKDFMLSNVKKITIGLC